MGSLSPLRTDGNQRAHSSALDRAKVTPCPRLPVAHRSQGSCRSVAGAAPAPHNRPVPSFKPTPVDWGAARAAKEDYWRRLSSAERLQLADEQRHLALTLHPDWPTDEQRAADLEHHQILLERMDRAWAALKR